MNTTHDKDMGNMDRHNGKERFSGLAEGYFSATLSQEEERELLEYVTHEGKDDPDFDEVRAVMGYLAAKKALQREQPGRISSIVWKTLSAAAAVALAIILGIHTGRSGSESYISYADGKKVTNQKAVMQNVDDILGEIFAEDSGPELDDILDNILNK